MSREEQEVAMYFKQVAAGIKSLFLQGYAAGVGANIDKGEKKAHECGVLAGLAVLRLHNDALGDAEGQMEVMFDEEKDRFFGKDKPKVEVAPAHLLSKNGKLIVN